MHTQTLVPSLVSKYENKTLANMAAVFGGVLLISLLAQVVIPLPWTPVPITGQTFGVSLVSLMWGWKRGGTVLLSYISLGSIGFPIFAGASAGFSGATVGYLFGMFLASVIVGKVVDSGFTKTYAKTLLTTYLGSAVVLSCGVFGLSFFLPLKTLLVSGVLPFLPGDLLKNLLASKIAFTLNKK